MPNRSATLQPEILPAAACPEQDPEARTVRLANGNVLIARAVPDRASYDICARIYNSRGREISDELCLSTGRAPARFPAINALPDGGFLLVHESGRGGPDEIVLRQFDAAGCLETLAYAHYDKRAGGITGIVAELSVPA